MAEEKVTNTSNSSGMDPKTSGLLSWLGTLIGAFTFIGGVVPLVFFIIEKDTFAKKHAAQALGTFAFGILLIIILSICTFVTFGLAICITGPLMFVVIGYMVVVSVLGMVKSNQGEMYKDPIIGNWVEGIAK